MRKEVKPIGNSGCFNDGSSWTTPKIRINISMRLIEISKKYFTLASGTLQLLETYTDPAQQLVIDFQLIHQESGKSFYKAVVSDIVTHENLLLIYFDLDSDNPDILTIANIMPLKSTGKQVHTTVGTQNTGIDMGNRAIKWIYREIHQFVLKQGYNIKQIVSSNRYTGARAHLNQQNGDNLQDFDVRVNVREHFVYDCDTELITYIK
jgi:hypothetical protein